MKHTRRNTFKKAAAFLLAVMLLATMMPMVSVSAQVAEYTGTLDNPTAITTPEQFASITSGNYYLANDIELTSAQRITLNGNFALDGCGKTITAKGRANSIFAVNSASTNNGTVSFYNLQVDAEITSASEQSGHNGVLIDNTNYLTGITIDNVNITATMNVGRTTYNHGLAGFIGFVGNSGVLVCSNSIMNGTITDTGSSSTIGGFVGHNQGTLTFKNCRNNATIEDYKDGGGCGSFVGLVYKGSATLENCRNAGTITGAKNTAAMIGNANKNSVIFNGCDNVGVVTNGGTATANFVATNSNNVTIKYQLGLNNGATAAYMQYTKANEGKRDVRFILVLDEATLTATDPQTTFTLTVSFKLANGSAVTRTFNSVTTYTEVIADGQTYTVADGAVMCGCVITGVPDTEWDTVELTFDASVDAMDFSGSVSK